MSEIHLGKLRTGGEQRDAIHFAVAPVVAAGMLYPGQDVGIVGASNCGGRIQVGVSASPIGIVDPFLKSTVEPGQEIWMMLYPNTITSLRHEWVHPAFRAVTPSDASHNKESARLWLEEKAREIGVDFDELIDDAKDFIETGCHRVEGGRFEGCYLGDDFWDQYEIFTETKVSEDDRGGVYSCSC